VRNLGWASPPGGARAGRGLAAADDCYRNDMKMSAVHSAPKASSAEEALPSSGLEAARKEVGDARACAISVPRTPIGHESRRSVVEEPVHDRVASKAPRDFANETTSDRRLDDARPTSTLRIAPAASPAFGFCPWSGPALDRCTILEIQVGSNAAAVFCPRRLRGSHH